MLTLSSANAVSKIICIAVRRMATHENTGTDLDDKIYHSALTTSIFANFPLIVCKNTCIVK